MYLEARVGLAPTSTGLQPVTCSSRPPSLLWGRGRPSRQIAPPCRGLLEELHLQAERPYSRSLVCLIVRVSVLELSARLQLLQVALLSKSRITPETLPKLLSPQPLSLCRLRLCRSHSLEQLLRATRYQDLLYLLGQRQQS